MMCHYSLVLNDQWRQNIKNISAAILCCCLLESSWAVDWCQVVIHTLHTLLGPFTHLCLCHDDILREIKYCYVVT